MLASYSGHQAEYLLDLGDQGLSDDVRMLEDISGSLAAD